MAMIRSRWLALLFLLSGAACNKSGDFESNCTLSCSLPDGRVVQGARRVACCGEHDNPTHSGEEGSACTEDWVSTRTQQLCDARMMGYFDPDAGFVSLTCPADAFHCSCDAPHTYASFEGCD
jgi:hypothetical protein